MIWSQHNGQSVPFWNDRGWVRSPPVRPLRRLSFFSIKLDCMVKQLDTNKTKTLFVMTESCCCSIATTRGFKSERDRDLTRLKHASISENNLDKDHAKWSQCIQSQIMPQNVFIIMQIDQQSPKLNDCKFVRLPCTSNERTVNPQPDWTNSPISMRWNTWHECDHNVSLASYHRFTKLSDRHYKYCTVCVPHSSNWAEGSGWRDTTLLGIRLMKRVYVGIISSRWIIIMCQIESSKGDTSSWQATWTSNWWSNDRNGWMVNMCSYLRHIASIKDRLYDIIQHKYAVTEVIGGNRHHRNTWLTGCSMIDCEKLVGLHETMRYQLVRFSVTSVMNDAIWDMLILWNKQRYECDWSTSCEDCSMNSKLKIIGNRINVNKMIGPKW